MVGQPNILAFVMAGGEGNRLRPLTAELPKPALRFGGNHRNFDCKRYTVTSAGTIVIPPGLMGDGVAQRYPARAA